MLEVLTVSSAKGLGVNELLAHGRYARRSLADELGIFEDEKVKLAFLRSDNEAQAMFLHGKLEELTKELQRLVTQHTPTSLAEQLVEARRLLKQQQVHLTAAHQECRVLEQEAKLARSALRKLLRSKLTPTVKAPLKKKFARAIVAKKKKKKPTRRKR